MQEIHAVLMAYSNSCLARDLTANGGQSNVTRVCSFDSTPDGNNRGLHAIVVDPAVCR